MPNIDTTRVRQAQPALDFPTELRLTTKLGVPLALGELGWMSTYIVDALMVGRLPHSALSIAASSLGNTIFYAIAFCAIGLMTGVETLVAQAHGIGDEGDGIRSLAQTIWFVVVGTPLVILATLAFLPLLPVFGTPPDLLQETRRYVHALVWSTAPLLLYWAVRRYLQSVEQVAWVTFSLLTAGVVNFAADWAFLYGHLGLPAFGVPGSGWATCVVRVYAVAVLLIALYRRDRISKLWSLQIFNPDFPRLKTLFRIGWAAALESLANLSVSTYLTILCARLGSVLLAAHQVVLDLDAFVFMVPLGLSYATAARVGQSAGRNSISQVRRGAQASLLLAFGFTCIAASLFAGFPRFWAGLYTTDPAVVTAAAPIFLLCGILQFGDAIGIVLSAALVGVGNTRTSLCVNVIWSWVLGMPLSYALAFRETYGLEGLWIGRVVAAVGSSITIYILWQRQLRRGNSCIKTIRSSRRYHAACTPGPVRED